MKLLSKLAQRISFFVLLALVICISSCTPPSTAVGVREIDPGESVSGVSGLGIESKDIVVMSEKMVVDLLRDSVLSKDRTPSIIIDDTRFRNESSQIININMLTDRLRIELMRAVKGKIKFVSRQNEDLALKENEITGVKYDPADYRLIGRITSLSTASNQTGVRSNYLMFSFEILDLSNSNSVWGNFYEVKKIGADDTVYR
jgi:penicillin-binding protein activator